MRDRLNSLAEINNPEFTQRGLNNCLVLYKRIQPDGSLKIFVRTTRDVQDTGKNIVTIRPKLRPKSLRTIAPKSKRTLGQLPVELSCTCKAFQYWGPAYNLTQKAAKVGRIENRPPDTRDPSRVNYLCKHIIAAYDVFKNELISNLYKEF